MTAPSNSTHITITGTPEMKAKLQKLAAAVGKKGSRVAVRAGALVVLNSAKEKAPYRTGTLRRSLEMEDGPGDTEVTVGTDLEYAPYVEFGTSRMGAQPFLRPAFDENQDEVYREIGDALEDLLAHAA